MSTKKCGKVTRLFFLQGWLPVHCAAAHGLTSAIETVVLMDKDGDLNFLKEEESAATARNMFGEKIRWW